MKKKSVMRTTFPDTPAKSLQKFFMTTTVNFAESREIYCSFRCFKEISQIDIAHRLKCLVGTKKNAFFSLTSKRNKCNTIKKKGLE